MQIIQFYGHQVDFDEVPPFLRVFARLRLEPYELLEKITIFSTTKDMKDMAMVMEMDDEHHFAQYPGSLCSALRLDTSTKRSLAVRKVPAMDKMVLGEASSDEGTFLPRTEMFGMMLNNVAAVALMTCDTSVVFRSGKAYSIVVCWQPVPWQLVTEGKLNPKRVVAVLLGAGHHVHAVAFKIQDDSLRGWVLDDEGVNHLYRDSPTLNFLVSSGGISPP